MNIRKLPAELFARRLIQAGRADVMPDESRRRILTGLGVSVPPPLSKELAQVTKVTAAKGLLAGVGALGAMGALSIWAAAQAWQPAAAPVEKVVAPSSVVAVVVTKDEQVPAAQVGDPADRDPANRDMGSAAPPVVNGAPRGARAPGRGAGETVARDSLNLELTKVDSARDALLRGDPGVALRMLDQYNAEFPAGALRTEAQVLRIEALAARGERAQVARMGGAFLARQPNGAYARRVRALMGASAPAPQKP